MSDLTAMVLMVTVTLLALAIIWGIYVRRPPALDQLPSLPLRGREDSSDRPPSSLSDAQVRKLRLFRADGVTVCGRIPDTHQALQRFEREAPRHRR
jgi:hypothetical protein